MINIVLAAIVGLLCGAIFGVVIWQFTRGKKVSGAQEKADKILEKARNEEKDLLLNAKDEALKFKVDAEKDLNSKTKYTK